MAHKLLSRGTARAARIVAFADHRLAPAAAFRSANSIVKTRDLSSSISRSWNNTGPRNITAMSTAQQMAPSAAAFAKEKPVPFEPASYPSVSASAADPKSWAGDLLVLCVTEEDFKVQDDVVSIEGGALKDIDAALGGVLSDIVALGDFKGEKGSKTGAVRVGKSSTKFISMVGLGKADKVTTTPEWGVSPFVSTGKSVVAIAKDCKAVKAAVAFPSMSTVDAAALGQFTEGVMGAGYESTRFKSKPKPGSKLVSVELLTSGVSAEAALSKAASVAKGVALTKYLVEAPPNVCTPSHIAAAAAHIAALSNGCMDLKVLEKKECEELGMGCFLGVSECSEEPPKFIHLKYTPKGEIKKKIAVVGKGLTFDAGGYNIKAGPGSMIELMKFDMGGAGATLGAARIIAETQPEGVEISFIIASCENMIDGKGMRPGDILVSANGKTVEVNNTDAEGRLTLCDALWYAQEKVGATAIVDIATLTGACIIALGNDIAGLFTPSDYMAEKLASAGKATGEKLWRMPMEESYFESMKSSVADMKNTGSRAGGSISASMFLKQFIKEGVEWAHLDVAGPVWDEKASLPTGYGAALLAEWATAQGK